MTSTNGIKPPLFPIWDTISLEELGYDKGSEVRVSINATRDWELAWSRVFDLKKEEDESVTDFEERFIEAQYPLAAMVIKSITLKSGDDTKTWDTVDVDTLREIDNADASILRVVMRERNERSVERAANTTLTFRERRSDAFKARKEGKFKGSLGGDKPTNDNQTDK